MLSQKNKKNSFSRFLNFIRLNKFKYLSGVGILLFINLLQLATPKITGMVFDSIHAKSVGQKGLLLYAGLIIGTALSMFILNYLSRIQIIGASNLFEYVLRNDMFKHLLTLSMKYFNKNSVGDLMALSVNDVSSIRMAMGRGIMLVVDTVFLLIFSMAIMARTVDLKLTLLICLPFPVLILTMTKFGKVINKRFRNVQESFANLTRKAQENISGIRVIKAFSQENEEINNFNQLNQDNYKINMRLVRIWGVFFPLIHLLSSLSHLIVLFFGGILVIRKTISLGDFIALNGYINIIVRPIGHIGMIINFIERGRASMDRIHELFEQCADIFDENPEYSNQNDDNQRLEGRIEFKNLTFSYNKNQKPILKNINITIEPGKTLAIIGKVGSGKTTLANLILRLYNPLEKGQLLIDMTDITEIPVKMLRDSIGYVPQDNYLFSSTIRENIAFSPHEYSMEQVKEAAATRQVYDSIMEFPDKFDTMLGERGVNLSGGQKQRVSIARALVKDPPVLILDDCLSAVDTKTERNILEGLRQIMQDRTCIIIAHRISTIKDADEIIVLDKGEIIERGTHLQLVDHKGLYNRIYQRQLLEEKVEGGST